MCGINGFIEYNRGLDISENRNLEDIIKLMNNKIIHRGPDEGGVFIDKRFAFGMRRLSIIDINKGSQPIFNNDKTLMIIMNGEIYNYKKLKEDLIFSGCRFKTDSDTEVALVAFQKFGVNCFNMFQGMFALAIYDLRKNEVIIARDRTGEKPLYYYDNKGIFTFSSEMKSIIEVINHKLTIDKKALNLYLMLNYVPAPFSIFKEVKKLMPGHFIIFNQKEGVKEYRRYWEYNIKIDNKGISYKDYKKLLKEKVENSVKESLNSDVPLGTFLSGGIDSNIITGIAAKFSKNKINSYTIGFEDKKYDESKQALISSKKHKTKHNLLTINFDNFKDEFSFVIDKMDEPFADPAIFPTYVVSKFASKDVKVILTGDAGDEIFAGYEKYLIGYYSEKFNNLPNIFKMMLNKVSSILPLSLNFTRKLKKVIDNQEESKILQHINLMSLGFKNHELNDLLNEDFFTKESFEYLVSRYPIDDQIDDISKSLIMDFNIVLEGDMLAKVDRASMLNSIETRTPFLSYEILDLVMKMPTDFKIKGNKKKIILKDTFKEYIPKNLKNKAKKGFNVPVSEWLKDDLKLEIIELTEEKFILRQGIFKYEYIKTIINEHFEGIKDRGRELWNIYIFQKWYIKYEKNIILVDVL